MSGISCLSTTAQDRAGQRVTDFRRSSDVFERMDSTAAPILAASSPWKGQSFAMRDDELVRLNALVTDASARVCVERSPPAPPPASGGDHPAASNRATARLPFGQYDFQAAVGKRLRGFSNISDWSSNTDGVDRCRQGSRPNQ